MLWAACYFAINKTLVAKILSAMASDLKERCHKSSPNKPKTKKDTIYFVLSILFDITVIFEFSGTRSPHYF